MKKNKVIEKLISTVIAAGFIIGTVGCGNSQSAAVEKSENSTVSAAENTAEEAETADSGISGIGTTKNILVTKNNKAFIKLKINSKIILRTSMLRFITSYILPMLRISSITTFSSSWIF